MKMQAQVIELTEGKGKVDEEKGEEVRTTTSLPKLEASSNSEAAVTCGDWLTRLQTIVGSMTKNSKTWWAEVMAEVNTSYKKYLAANPITRLEIWPEIKGDQKLEQLEQKVSHLLLEALEESLVSEIIFKVMTVYQPGGIKEKAQLVKDLQEPRVESTTQEAIKVLREWE